MEAVYRVMEDIEDYDIIVGLKNEISKLVMQKYAMDQMCAQRNNAITTLVKLQPNGVTDEEILNLNGFLSRTWQVVAPL